MSPTPCSATAGCRCACNLHSSDLIGAIAAFHRSPRPAAVYNIGGGRPSSCSVLEAIALSEEISGRRLDWSLSPTARIGDHRWWISDNRPLQADFPEWRPRYDLRDILQEIHDANAERWLTTA